MQKKPYEKPAIVELPERSWSMNKRIDVSVDALLPVAQQLLSESNGIAGYFYRGWGAGWKFEANRIEHGCPMVLWAVPGIPVLHWVARIEQVHSRGIPPSGSLRLVSNPSQPGAMQCGLSSTATSSHVDLNSLGCPDKHGGWTVGDHLGLHVPVEGLLGVRIQAIAQNCRVLWSAISQAHPE